MICFHGLLGTYFKRLIPDQTVTETGSVKRLIFCSGKIYYELNKHRKTDNRVAISRVEQVSIMVLAVQCSTIIHRIINVESELNIHNTER